MIVAATTALAVMTGCSSEVHPIPATPAVRAAPPATKAPGSAWHVVALGDSVTAGAACGCTPFPELYGRDIAHVRGRVARVTNLGTSGMDSSDLLEKVKGPRSSFTRAVSDADIDVVTIGANDFSPDHDAVVRGECLQDDRTECVQDELDQMSSNVSAILVRIRELRASRPTAVLVTGYWNVFEDGDVARDRYPDIGVKATQALTVHVNEALRAAATAEGDTYVDLYAPFHGPEAAGNTTNLLADDGDHPNEAGQALIARRLVAAGLPGLVAG